MTAAQAKELQKVKRTLAGASVALTSLVRQSAVHTSDHLDAQETISLNMAHQHIGNAIATIDAALQQAADKHFGGSNAGR